MNRIATRIIAISIAVIMVLFFVLSLVPSVFAQPDSEIIYQNTTEETIANGMVKKKIERFTKSGWLNINVIIADLSSEYIHASLLRDKRGVNFMSNVLRLSEQEEDIIAALNGDFFQRLRNSSEMGSSIGPVVEHGRLLSSPAHEKNMSALSITKENEVLVDYWNRELTITAPNGNTANVKHINKYDPLDSIVIYDRNWNTTSFGSNNNILEVVVVDGIITEMRREMPPVEIPENGYIICHLPEYNPFLIENFEVGDEVKLEIKTMPDINNLELALGAGAVLVKDGKKVLFTHDIKGRHPRSAIGTDTTKNLLFMVTADGRQADSIGMTQDELADLLIGLGVYDAVNLDGGGSTTMISRPLGESKNRVINKLSDGWLRNVTNAIGIKYTAPRTNLSELIVQSTNENVFVNSSLKFSVKGYDSNYNHVEVDISKVKWSVSGVAGKFIGNIFYPSEVGHGTIKATYENATGYYKIDVLSLPAEIIIEPATITLKKGDRVKLSLRGKNKYGYSAPLQLSDVNIEIPENIAKIEGDHVQAISGGTGILTVSVGRVNSHTLISVDADSVVDNFEKQNGSYLPYPSYVVGRYEISNEKVKDGSFSGKLSFDFTSLENEAKSACFVYSGEGIEINRNAEKIGLWVHAQKYMNHWLKAGIRDKNNNLHRINFANKINWDGWKYVEADIPKDIEGVLRLTRIYVVQTDPSIKNIGSVYFDSLTFVSGENHNPESVEVPDNNKLPDELNRSVELLKGEDNFRFAVFGNTIKRNTMLNNIIMQRLVNALNQHSSLSAFTVNAFEPEDIFGLETEQIVTSTIYAKKEFKGSTFINLDSSKDGFRKSNQNQWKWINDNIDNISGKNVFIFLSNPLNETEGFTDKKEAQLFQDMLTEKLAKRGKNVIVFYNGDKNECNIDRGVRYISVKGIKEISAKNISALIKGYQYILVTVNNGNVTYEIKPLFEAE